MDQKIIDKFWANVEKTDGCWLWKGKVDDRGLPRIVIGTAGRANYQKCSPRRLSLELAGIPVLSSRKVIPPTCGNTLCVNPDHLGIGDEARFHVRVDKDSEAHNGCWMWLGDFTEDMYGQFSIMRQGITVKERAHVYSWELHNNCEIIKGIGSVVMHSCDHPWCVNPDHLSLGTHKDNAQDKNQKMRHMYGEKHVDAKLTDAKVKEIRDLHAAGKYTPLQLAHLFDVSRSAIYNVVNRITWKHVQ